MTTPYTSDLVVEALSGEKNGKARKHGSRTDLLTRSGFHGCDNVMTLSGRLSHPWNGSRKRKTGIYPHEGLTRRISACGYPAVICLRLLVAPPIRPVRRLGAGMATGAVRVGVGVALVRRKASAGHMCTAC